ncbi:hypothetical protein RMSM_06864 [Rhodopirellula maiorica SM1]|uniref:N-sulphoglucosamine sulphohydrolase C-terminal domain-containing protein n=1 Tax=Rhodopirellula maiorica SM1 TaxID=1265738 RepID=M5RAW2_9BACT|nr:hypothetical protein RMSM_06864 [Rhodopirellula maiorica SM1]
MEASADKRIGRLEQGKMPAGTVAQLYDMEADPAEQENLYRSHPEVAQRLLSQLESDVRRGRSTDGPELSNDVRVNLKQPRSSPANKSSAATKSRAKKTNKENNNGLDIKNSLSVRNAYPFGGRFDTGTRACIDRVAAA